MLRDRERLGEHGHVGRQVAGGIEVRSREGDALAEAAVDLHPDGLHARAAVAVAAAARQAGAAGHEWLDGDALPERQALDPLPELLDDAHELVPLGAGIVHIGVVAKVEVDVRTAQSDGLHPDQDLTWSDGRLRSVL